MFKTKTRSVMPPAQKATKKPYERPAFTVIPLNVEAPLLSGSGTDGKAGFAGVKKDTK